MDVPDRSREAEEGATATLWLRVTAHRGLRGGVADDRDKYGRAVVKTVGGQPFEGIYDLVTGAPRLNADPLKGLVAAGVDATELGARSYGSIMSKQEAFLRRHGVREKASADFSAKAAAGRTWRRALREGDPDRIAETFAAMRAEYHKARTDVRSSIRAQARSAHPLMRVPGRWRKDFLDSLSERDRKEYELAVEYWWETWQRLTLPRH